MDVLFFLFGCVGLIVAALFCLSIQPPKVLTGVPYLTTELFPRVGQALVVAATYATFTKIGRIPAILRDMLKIRHAIAISEARRSTLNNAPGNDVGPSTFPTNPEFGKSVSLDDLLGGKK